MEIFASTGIERQNSKFFCPDCDLTLHENDKENHLKGGRHIYKVRLKKQESTSKSPPQFYCDVCTTQFTNLHFFTIHQGSKTHKRNVRRVNRKLNKRLQKGEFLNDKTAIPADFRPKARRVANAQDVVSSVIVTDTEGICDYNGIREKYRPRNNKNPEGIKKIYISSAIAYWAVRLTFDSNIQDFKIWNNDKEWGDFGDVVVEIQHKETNEHPASIITSAIQFKDTSYSVKSIGSFSEGRYAFAKILTQVNSVKLRNDIENKKFIVFTTAHMDVKDSKIKVKNDLLHKAKQECDCNGQENEIQIIAKSVSNRRKLALNTSDDNDNVFLFFTTDNMHTLPKIYVFSHQKKQRNFGSLIDELISEHLSGDQRVNIHRELIKYVENWSEGYLGGHYKLRKEDVLVKLCHTLLFKYRVPPVVKAAEGNTNYNIWQQTVSSVDVTILKKHPVIIFKVCEPLNLIIESELGLKIDTSTSTLNLLQKTIEKIQNHVLKMYLFEETIGELQDDIPLEIAYDFFWKAGLIPLLLEVEDVKQQESVLNVITLMKSRGLTRRYFLMSPDENLRNTLKYYKDLRFFVNVDDIANKIPAWILDSVKISITDTFSMSLKEIQRSDVFFQKTLSAHEFFDMCLGRYSFKPFSNILARRDGQDTQLVLGDTDMLKLKEEVESKDEMKDFGCGKKEKEEQQFLRGIKPYLFC